VSFSDSMRMPRPHAASSIVFAATAIRKVLLPIAGLFLLSRAILLLIGVLTASQIAAPAVVAGDTLLSYLCRFDCAWYLGVAQDGYSTVYAENQPGATNFGFYPFFPLLVRIVSPLFGGDVFHAALFVSNLCFYAALVYVYRYARLLGLERAAALLSVALLCILPHSIVFSAAYSESPFLLLLVVAMYYLRRENYLVAAIAAAMLSATRATGTFFVIFALAWIVRSGGVRALFTPWRAPERFVPVLFAPLGLFAFWSYCFLMTGDAFAGPHTMFHGWGWYFLPPWDNLAEMLQADDLRFAFALTALALLAGSLLLLRQGLYEEFIFCAALILLMCSGAIVGSLFRYWLVLFPVWIALARVLASRPLLAAMTFSILALFNGLMMSAWTLQKFIAI
jgi:mannosyltransferase PIG-V